MRIKGKENKCNACITNIPAYNISSHRQLVDNVFSIVIKYNITGKRPSTDQRCQGLRFPMSEVCPIR